MTTTIAPDPSANTTAPEREPLIAVEDIAYVRCQAPHLDLMARFLADFGLVQVRRTDDTLYMGTRAGAAPYAHVTQRGDTPMSLGLGLVAQSAEDLEKLARHLGTRVEANDEPAGGSRVRVTDPGGLVVDVLHGFSRDVAPAVRASLQPNAIDRRERLGAPLRHAAGASHAMRLGHAVLLVPDLTAALDFYMGVLGMRVSDTYHAEDPGQTIFAFLHCGLGERWTDHHTLAMGTPPMGVDRGRFDHIAFEVLDLDDLMGGHTHLREQGWTHSWGVGRHVYGSQIFDYWRDPWGLKIEHWTDGDRVNRDHVPGKGPLTPQSLAQWAPPFDPSFFE